MNIAISLICHNDEHILEPCLTSLLKSDLLDHKIKLFCYDNGSGEKMKQYLNSLNVEKLIITSNQNDGIVIPRIEIYKKIIEENFDFLLEIHSDMVFPKIWLKPLLDIFDSETAILEPHIYLPKNRIISSDEFEKILPSLQTEVQYNKCRQTHPWLVNLKILNSIDGYYDPAYSPHECEDDDLVYRILKNNFKIKTTGKSWVVHYGGMVRHKLLQSCLSKNMEYFTKKNQVSFERFLTMFENHPHKYE